VINLKLFNLNTKQKKIVKMKKSLLLALCLAFASTKVQAQSVDYYTQQQNEVEFKRLYQQLEQLKQTNEEQAKYIRELELSQKEINNKMKATQKRIDDLLDLWINFENVSLPNLTSADASLADRINQTNSKIKDQNRIWNWGEETRDCPNIGKHQQVKTISSPNNDASITYLCFDGKVLHLKTESNLPPIH
jgi:predicted RNase H-like nuclease (RuvC/YqgF family)